MLRAWLLLWSSSCRARLWESTSAAWNLWKASGVCTPKLLQICWVSVGCWPWYRVVSCCQYTCMMSSSACRCQALHGSPDASTLAAVMQNIHTFYKQFQPLVQEDMQKGLAPIEKHLKACRNSQYTISAT